MAAPAIADPSTHFAAASGSPGFPGRIVPEFGTVWGAGLRAAAPLGTEAIRVLMANSRDTSLATYAKPIFDAVAVATAAIDSDRGH